MRSESVQKLLVHGAQAAVQRDTLERENSKLKASIDDSDDVSYRKAGVFLLKVMIASLVTVAAFLVIDWFSNDTYAPACVAIAILISAVWLEGRVAEAVFTWKGSKASLKSKKG